MAKKTTGASTTGASTAIGTGATMSDSQRMAGDIWSTYDPKSQGGAGFDNDDFKYLRGQNWSNADLFKAAAKSGNIDAKTDQKLRNLGREMTLADLPKSVRSISHGDWDYSNDPESYQERYNFMGGDKNDPDNYYITGRSNERNAKAPAYGVFDMINTAEVSKLNENAKSKNGQKIYQWNGLNADGSANAVTSWKEDGDGKRQYQTWLAPKAETPASGTDSGGGTTTPTPSTPSFNLSDYLSGGSSSSSSSSENDSLMPRQFQASTRPSMYESWSTNQSQQPSSPSYSSSYTPRNLTTSSSSSSSSSSSDHSNDWRRFWNPSAASSNSSSSSSSSSSTETDPDHGNVAQATFRQLADEFRTRYQRPRTTESN